MTSQQRPRSAFATTALIACALAIAACGGGAPDRQPAQTEVKAQPSSPISVEWTDAELEKSADRNGYGSKPETILARSADGALVFTPQTTRDHIATDFTALQNYGGDRSLELILDVRTAGGEACVANLQDQALNTLATAPCRTAGEQRVTAKVPNTVTGVRVYFLSANREPLRLPARMQLTEHR